MGDAIPRLWTQTLKKSFFDIKIPFVQGQNSTAQYQDWLDKKDRVKGVKV
jgi:hypothetical protein